MDIHHPPMRDAMAVALAAAGATPRPAAGGQAAVEALAQALGPTVADPFAAARALLPCVQAGVIDFSVLQAPLSDLAAWLPAAAWKVLQDHARALGREVAWVVLRAPAGAADVDLRGLQHPVPRVSIACRPDAVLRVYIPAGAPLPEAEPEVDEKAPVSPPPEKSWVIEVHEDGHEGPKHTLPGLIYDREHRDWLHADADAAARAHALQVAARSRTGEALFPSGDGKAGVPKRVWCRHLGLQWDTDQEALDAARAAAPPDERPRFAYKPYESAESISAHVDPGTEERYERTRQHGAIAWGTEENFWPVLASQCEGLQPGQTRRLGVDTGLHFMVARVTLKEKTLPDGRTLRRYVVKFYDSTDGTGRHRRLVVTRLDRLAAKARSLKRWGRAPEHSFDPGGAPLFRLYDLSPHPPVAPPADRVPARHKTSAQYLHFALSDGCADKVRTAVRAILALPKDEALKRLRARPADGYCGGLGVAAINGRTEALLAYMNAILEAPEDLLSTADKCSLLLDNDGWLQEAMARGHTGTVAAYIEAINRARAGVLHAADAMALLPPPLAGPAPLLHQLCRAGQCDAAIRGYLSILLASDCPDKSACCASMHGTPPKTAARAALDSGHPGAAAAMLQAVLTAAQPASLRLKWAAALGVTVEEVLQALAQQVGRAGVSAHVIEAAWRALQPQRRARTFRKGDAVVPAVDEGLRWRCRTRHLRFVKLQAPDAKDVSAPPMMVCEADGFIAGLQPMVASPPSRTLYLLPAGEVERDREHPRGWLADMMGRGTAAADLQAVEEHIARVASVPSKQLPLAAKHAWLKGRNGQESPLATALRARNAATAAAYARQVAARRAQLSPEVVRDLLKSPLPPAPGQAEGVPLLHARSGEKDCDALVYAFFKAVLSSDLPLQDKADVLAARHGGTTAAQAAMARHNPGFAAAMACAVLEMDNEHDRQALLQQLGLDLGALLRALQAPGPRQRMAQHAAWHARLAAVVAGAAGRG